MLEYVAQTHRNGNKGLYRLLKGQNSTTHSLRGKLQIGLKVSYHLLIFIDGQSGDMKIKK